MSASISNDDFLDSDLNDRIDFSLYWKWLPGFIVLVLVFGAGTVLGWIGWQTQTLTQFSVVYWGGFMLGIYWLLLRPFANQAYPYLFDRVGPFWRIAVGMVLLIPPLISFGYLIGNIHGWVNGYEIAFAVLPSVCVGLIIFESTTKSWFASLVMGNLCFISFFLMNDILSPFQTVFTYGVSHAYFYQLKAAGLCCMVALVAAAYLREFKSAALFVVSALLFVIEILMPAVVFWSESYRGVSTDFGYSLFFIGPLLMAILSGRLKDETNPIFRRMTVALLGGFMILLAFHFLGYFHGLWALKTFTANVIAVLILGLSIRSQMSWGRRSTLEISPPP